MSDLNQRILSVIEDEIGFYEDNGHIVDGSMARVHDGVMIEVRVEMKAQARRFHDLIRAIRQTNINEYGFVGDGDIERLIKEWETT